MNKDKQIFSLAQLLTKSNGDFVSQFDKTVSYLQQKKNILFVTTSNRFQMKKAPIDIPKSTQIALTMASKLDEKVTVVDAAKLKINICEANISRMDGNTCGAKDALLKDKEKDPSGYHRCWASINNPNDELWKITKPLFECDAVVFFGSIRWGQANSIYQKIIERLSWIENRHSTLGENNVVANIDAGCIFTGHNFNGSNVIDLQKQVMKFYGFKTPDDLFWNWQWTDDEKDETAQGYKEDAKDFNRIIKLTIKGKEA
jgi:multimeric flavodoxin WrbA